MMAMASVKSDSGFVDNWQSGKSLAECNLHMLTSEDSCDVSFRVGKDQKIVRAHRYVLISRSCVFHAMLCGPLSEKDEITITDVEADIFTELLGYLYTNESEPTPANVTGLLYLAKKYAVGGLEHLCLTYLKSSLSAGNACIILEQAHVFDEKQLYDIAMKVILENGEKCLCTEGFKHLCRECFDKVISLDYLGVKAEMLVVTVISWTEEECKRQGREISPVNLRSILGDTLYSIPFPDMDQKRYVKEVLPRQILTSEENVAIMAHFICPENDPSPFRTKRPDAKEDNGQLSMSIRTAQDVIFYNKHQKKVFSFGISCDDYDSIQFTCSHDVVLLGVHVYSPQSTNVKYCVKVGRYELGISWIMKSENQSATDTKHENLCIKTIYLQEPQVITKDIPYIVRVSCAGWLPRYEGLRIAKKVTVNQCTVSNISKEFGSLLTYIYGLILKA